MKGYFDLEYTCEPEMFFDVFRETSHLHGYLDGEMIAWTAQEYKDFLVSNPSPAAEGAVREDEILLVDFASSTQALVKVRVRVADLVFIDYLTWHFIEGTWLITSKGFHQV